MCYVTTDSVLIDICFIHIYKTLILYVGKLRGGFFNATSRTGGLSCFTSPCPGDPGPGPDRGLSVSRAGLWLLLLSAVPVQWINCPSRPPWTRRLPWDGPFSEPPAPSPTVLGSRRGHFLSCRINWLL